MIFLGILFFENMQFFEKNAIFPKKKLPDFGQKISVTPPFTASDHLFYPPPRR